MASISTRLCIFKDYCEGSITSDAVEHNPVTERPENVISTFDEALNNPFDDRLITFLARRVNQDPTAFVELFNTGQGNFLDIELWKRTSLIIDLTIETKAPFVYVFTFNGAFERILCVPVELMSMLSLRRMAWYEEEKKSCILATKYSFFAQSLFSLDIVHSIDNGTVNEITSLLNLTKEVASSRIFSTILKLILIFKSLNNITTVGIVLLDLCILWGASLSLAQQAWSFLENAVMLNRKKFKAQNIDPSQIDRESLTMVAAVASTFLCVAGSMKVPSQMMLDKVMKRVSDLGRAANGATSLLQAMRKLFDNVYETVYEYLFGAPPPNTELGKVLDGLEEWFKEIYELTHLDSLNQVPLSFKICRSIEAAYHQGLTYSRRLAELRIPVGERATFNHHWTAISKLYDRVITRGCTKSEPRTEPLIIHLFGGSGVGKSGLTYLLSQDILSLEGLQNEVMEEVYFRNVEQEYWDGYKGQAITVYDDFGQMRDTVGKPNLEFMEIIRTGNIAPMPLHMAHLEEKDKTRFKSRAVILTSNNESWNMESLTCKEAFERRLDLHVEVLVNPKYKNSQGRVDASRCSSALQEDVYEFILHDQHGPILRNMSGKPQPYKLDYPQFRDIVLDRYMKRFNNSKAKMEYLINRAKILPKREFKAQVNSFPLCDALIVKAWLVARDVVIGLPQIDVPNWFSELSDLAVSFDNFADFEVSAISLIASRDESMLHSTDCDSKWQEVQNLVHEKYMYGKSKFDAVANYARKISLRLRESVQKCIEVAASKVPEIFIAIGTVFTLAAGSIMLFGWTDPSLEEHGIERTGDDNVDLANKIILARSLEDGEIPEYFDVGKKSHRQPKEKAGDLAESIQLDKRPRKTKFVHEDSVAESFEVDKRPRKSKGKFTYESQALIDTNARQLINTTVQSNVYQVSTLTENGDEEILANLTFVQGRIGIFVKHGVRRFKDILWLRNAFVPDGYKVSVSNIDIFPMTDSQGRPIDLVMLVFPRSVPRHATLTDNFVKAKDLIRFETSQAHLCSVHRVVKKSRSVFQQVLYSTGTITARNEVVYTLDDETIKLRSGYMYRIETSAGDCTAPLVVSSPSLPRKIVGFHVAGNRNGEALSQSLTHETLTKNISSLESFEAQVSLDLSFLDFDTEEMPQQMDGNFIPVGVAPKCVGHPVDTKLSESPIHGSYKEPTTAPAALRNVRVDGEVVNPMLKGLKKFGVQPPTLDPVLLKRCTTYLTNHLRKFRYGESRVLTWEECIRGIEGDPWYTPVNRVTSPGYPWIFKRNGLPGKSKWLGELEDYKFDDPELIAACELRESKAREGILVPPVWVDTLKDERRPIEKVNEGKTRVFSAGPMDFILNVRKYFLAFNAAMMHNRINNGFGPGINPYSNDWHRLAEHLKKHGPCLWAGDYSGFDAGLLLELVWSACDVINGWYNDSEENQRIRTVFFAGMANAIHLHGKDAFIFTHSQPSGNPLTTAINCIVNQLIIMYNFVKCTGENLSVFHENVSLIVFGDDHVINVTPEIAKTFNQVEFARACSEYFGMGYTDEAKTGVLVPIKTLDEVGFLKRSFRFEEESCMYVAPLELDVIREMPFWVRGDLDLEKRCVENCETAFKELSLHGLEVFEKYSKEIFDACVNAKMTLLPDLYSYEEYLEMEIDFLIG